MEQNPKKCKNTTHNKKTKVQNTNYQITNYQNTNIAKYKCNKLQMGQNANRKKSKNTKIQT